MAQVKVEDIVDHLSNEFKWALEDTLKEHFPNENFDTNNVFRTFKRNVYRRCSVWENVPDNLVEK